MREVVPHALWLGNAGDARDMRRVLDAGVKALVDLAEEERPPHLVRDIIYCRFPLIDGGDNSRHLLRMAVDTVASLLRDGRPTLVYCGAGMSRSPAVAAAALAKLHAEAPEMWLARITTGQSHDVAPRLWQEIVAACFSASAQ